MTKQEIINQAEYELLVATFSDPIVKTSKPVQRAIELCDAPIETMRTTESLVDFNNAYKLL